ncbi:cox2 [Symbiodinium sp. KB8]|nr:cox2 [Symbiodinium sp. KB8]
MASAAVARNRILVLLAAGFYFEVNSLISACEKPLQWRRAADVLAAMRRGGPRPDVVSYSATLSAGEKSEEWRCVLQLFGEMGHASVTRGLVSFDGALSLCLLSELRGLRLTPNTITYTASVEVAYATAAAACDGSSNAGALLDWTMQRDLWNLPVPSGAGLVSVSLLSVIDDCPSALKRWLALRKCWSSGGPYCQQLSGGARSQGADFLRLPHPRVDQLLKRAAAANLGDLPRFKQGLLCEGPVRDRLCWIVFLQRAVPIREMLGALKSVFWPSEAARPAETPALQNLAGDKRKAKLRDVKAEDYPTPEKYLEGAEIPTFYQFQSNMVADEDLKPGMCSGLEVDKRLTLPTRTHIRFLVTGQDVIHSFSIPSLGLKTDATPGRINRLEDFSSSQADAPSIRIPANAGMSTLLGRVWEISPCGVRLQGLAGEEHFWAPAFEVDPEVLNHGCSPVVHALRDVAADTLLVSFRQADAPAGFVGAEGLKRARNVRRSAVPARPFAAPSSGSDTATTHRGRRASEISDAAAVLSGIPKPKCRTMMSAMDAWKTPILEQNEQEAAFCTRSLQRSIRSVTDKDHSHFLCQLLLCCVAGVQVCLEAQRWLTEKPGQTSTSFLSFLQSQEILLLQLAGRCLSRLDLGQSAVRRSIKHALRFCRDVVARLARRPRAMPEAWDEMRRWVLKAPGRLLRPPSLLGRPPRPQPLLCSVKDCPSKGHHVQLTEDVLGPSGWRCRLHGLKRRCNVAGCGRLRNACVSEKDRFGLPGDRCVLHGARSCEVENCGRFARLRVHLPDEFGLPGRRCLQHSAHSRCTVQGCHRIPWGRVEVADKYGRAGRNHFASSDGPKKHHKRGVHADIRQCQRNVRSDIRPRCQRNVSADVRKCQPASVAAATLQVHGVQTAQLAEEDRCTYSDGQSWRCRRPRKEGQRVCEYHWAKRTLYDKWRRKVDVNSFALLLHSLAIDRSQKVRNLETRSPFLFIGPAGINTFIQREGVFYGQCSELCGTLHGFMPIVVEAVSPETYAAHARKWYKLSSSPGPHYTAMELLVNSADGPLEAALRPGPWSRVVRDTMSLFFSSCLSVCRYPSQPDVEEVHVNDPQNDFDAAWLSAGFGKFGTSSTGYSPEYN